MTADSNGNRGMEDAYAPAEKRYWRLTPDYCLRGWQKANGVLLHRPENEIDELDEVEFYTLMLCDGKTDLGMLPLTARQEDILRDYAEKGILSCHASPGPITEDQTYRYYENRYVRKVFWSLTGRCNYRCRHCYMDAPAGKMGELPLEDILRMIDQMDGCGVLECDLTGGEALARDDFWEIVDCLRSRKIRIGTLYSNGALVDEKVLTEFRKRDMCPELSISFGGFGWHDWMRGIKGAEESAVRALSLCRDMGFSTDVQMCIHRGNKDDLRENILRLSELGVTGLKASDVMDTDLWRRRAEGQELSTREYFDAMIAYIPAFFEDGMPMNVTLSQIIALKKDSCEYLIVPEKTDGTEKAADCHLCAAARYAVYVTPDGRLVPCMPMTGTSFSDHFPKILDIGLRSGLSDSMYMQFVDSRVRDLAERSRKCSKCRFLLSCGGGCRANALAVTDAGSMRLEDAFFGEDGNQCILFQEGYVERIHRTVEEAIQKRRRKQGS